MCRPLCSGQRLPDHGRGVKHRLDDKCRPESGPLPKNGSAPNYFHVRTMSTRTRERNTKKQPETREAGRSGEKVGRGTRCHKNIRRGVETGLGGGRLWRRNRLGPPARAQAELHNNEGKTKHGPSTKIVAMGVHYNGELALRGCWPFCQGEGKTNHTRRVKVAAGGLDGGLCCCVLAWLWGGVAHISTWNGESVGEMGGTSCQREILHLAVPLFFYYFG